MKIWKKLFSIFACLVLITGVIAACGEELGGDDDDIPSGNIRLVVWTVAPLIADYKNILKVNPKDKQSLFTETVVKGFEEENPGVSLTLRNKGWGDALNRELVLAIAGNTMPDVTVGEQYVPVYVDNDHFEALDLGQDIIDDLLSQTKSVAMKGGKVYAAPVWTGSFGLTINKVVLREAGVLGANDVPAQKYTDAGIDPLAPTTWEDLLTICQDIRTYFTTRVPADEYKGGILMSATGEGSAWRALPFMRSAYGEMVDENGVVEMDTPENLKAFEMMRELSKTSPSGSLSSINEDAIWELFFNSKAAYIVDGIDTITRVTNYAFEEGDVISVEIPTFEEDGVKANCLVGTGYYSISKNSTKKDIALKFIKYLLSDSVQLGMMREDMRVPTRLSILNGSEIKTLANYDAMQPYLIPFTDESYNFNGAIPAFLDNPVQIWEKWNAFIKRVLSNEGSLQTLLTNAHSDMLEAQQRT